MNNEINKVIKSVDSLSKNVDAINKMALSLDKITTKNEKQLKIIDISIKRIENKIDFIMNFLEELLIGDEIEDDDEDGAIYDSDETWAQDPDSWKDGEEYNDEDEEN